MGRFFNYNLKNIARIYDRLRKPQGVDVIAGLLHVHCKKPFQNIYLLDAGCGTGQHSQALLKMGIGEITLLDASPQMLSFAKEKLRSREYTKHKRVHTIVAAFPPFPFKDASFDAIMFNQSLHHLDDIRDGKNYPKLEQTLTDAKRILRQRGVLILSTVLSTTVRESIWYLQCQSEIKEKLAKTHLSVHQYMNMFDKHGFQCETAINLLTAAGANIYLNHSDPESILDEDWRQASSMFGIATDAETEEIISAIYDKKENGTLEEFVRENDHTNKRGFVTLFACMSKY